MCICIHFDQLLFHSCVACRTWKKWRADLFHSPLVWGGDFWGVRTFYTSNAIKVANQTVYTAEGRGTNTDRGARERVLLELLLRWWRAAITLLPNGMYGNGVLAGFKGLLLFSLWCSRLVGDFLTWFKKIARINKKIDRQNSCQQLIF